MNADKEEEETGCYTTVVFLSSRIFVKYGRQKLGTVHTHLDLVLPCAVCNRQQVLEVTSDSDESAASFVRFSTFSLFFLFIISAAFLLRDLPRVQFCVKHIRLLGYDGKLPN